MERVDLFTRAPLYALSASEPTVVVLLLSSGASSVPAWAAAAVVLVALAHTVACVAVLHSAFNHLRSGRRLSMRLVALTIGLTIAGLAVSASLLRSPTAGEPGSAPPSLFAITAAMLFCAALAVAVAPLLRAYQLLGVVLLLTVVIWVLQVAAPSPSDFPWALYFLFTIGLTAASYRLSGWVLGVVWEIDRARTVQARLSVAEERLRVARDLHDVLGRNLALIAVNSELAAQLARRGEDGAVDRMLAVRQTAQDSMREVREVVGGVRSMSLDAELAGARSVLRSAGISTRVIGDGTSLPPEVQATLGWVVREATTNIIRHAQSTTVRIELDIVPATRSSTGEAVLRVDNDGAHSSVPSKASSTGLIGLRERLVELGGDLTAGLVSGNRFQVQARLPLTEAGHAVTAGLESVP